jgi:ribosomal protein S18 acetylase RimI-like enzyme
MATVSTMSFQGARDFYEKLGYQIDFERKGYIQESRCFFMKKVLI